MSNATRNMPQPPMMPDNEPDFIELPSAAGVAPRTVPTTVRPSVRAVRPLPVQPAGDEPDRPWMERLARFLFGEEGAGFGMSLVVHAVLLAVLAIPVLRQATQGPIISTTVTESTEAPVEFDEIIDTELTLPEGGGQAQFELPDLTATETIPITRALLQDPASAGESQGDGVGDIIGEGMATLVPENAVTAGSFTAFTTPTFNQSFPRRFGRPEPEPGDAPLPAQPYYITIQIKVPEGTKRYPLSDLSGVVVGTDSYQLTFPYDRFRGNQPSVFVMSRNGERVRPRGAHVPVVDGVVQLVVLIPGARALVKDVIQVESKMLEEAQTLELVFGDEAAVGSR